MHPGGHRPDSNIHLHGAAKLANPAVKVLFEKLGNDTKKQVTKVLNKHRDNLGHKGGPSSTTEGN